MIKPSKSNDDVSGWHKQVMSATTQARADVDDVSESMQPLRKLCIAWDQDK